MHETPHVPDRSFNDVLGEVFSADEVGDREAAIRILEEARLVVHDPDLDAMLVERYLELSPDEAEKLLRQWWEQEHDRFSGAGLARVLQDQNRSDEALTVLTESNGSDESSEYWRLLSGLRDEQGDVTGAVAAMELYTRLAPEDPEAWMLLADMQQRAGQTARALFSLRRAGDTLPDRILPRMLRLRILADESRWREVRDLAESLQDGQYEDLDGDLLYDLRDLQARAYFVLGDFAAARHLWTQLIAERPTDGEVRCRLAELELAARRYRQALLILERYPEGDRELRILDIRLRSFLGLGEYDEADRIARQMEALDPASRLVSLVEGAESVASREYMWALECLTVEPPEPYRDVQTNLRLACLVRLGRWHEILPALKAIRHPDDAVLLEAAVATMAAGKLDLAERVIEAIEDQQAPEARSRSELLGPLRQSRRAAEARRQQQVDQADRQRWALENRDLRRRVRELEQHNAALADALAGSEAALERLLELVGVSVDGGVPPDWDAQLRRIAERAHKDALAQELQQAEQRLRSMLGNRCWEALSESVRASLREGEWLYAAVEGEDRDYGAALLEYARGLERAFKDAIFVPVRAHWARRPGPLARLHDEGHDPSLAPFVGFVLNGSHLTLGSMAVALERMGDVRRQGVSVSLMREQLGIDPRDERSLADWKRTAERLALAAEARNQPAHAGAVSREAVRQFRDLVLGTDGLLRALDAC